MLTKLAVLASVPELKHFSQCAAPSLFHSRRDRNPGAKGNLGLLSKRSRGGEITLSWPNDTRLDKASLRCWLPCVRRLPRVICETHCIDGDSLEGMSQVGITSLNRESLPFRALAQMRCSEEKWTSMRNLTKQIYRSTWYLRPHSQSLPVVLSRL